jgi:hypothetical protein
MSEEKSFTRGEAGGPEMDRKALLDEKLDALIKWQRSRASLQLGQPAGFWNVWALGPYQGAGLEPGRIIQVNQPATIDIVVWLNPTYPSPVSACTLITQFAAKIELSIFTSNMQTMQPEPNLTDEVCIQTTPAPAGGTPNCVYTHSWTFTPTREACLYETNICARVCNCQGYGVQSYYAFVRWVKNLDPEFLFGSPAPSPTVPPATTPDWEFNNPIRFGVFDFQAQNCCYP